jgi:hypothetical protein
MDDYLKHLESIIGTDSLKNLLLDFEHCSLIILDNLNHQSINCHLSRTV